MDKKLIEKSISVMKKAYAPYSNFLVGAAIQDENGKIHEGINVENSAYPSGTCAEESAISQMIVSGGKTIIKIAIAGRGKELCTPCGACRQRIREFSNNHTKIIICGEKGVRKTFLINELLPEIFGPENLK